MAAAGQWGPPWPPWPWACRPTTIRTQWIDKAGERFSLARVASTYEDITKAIVSFVNVKIVEAPTVPVIGSIVGKIGNGTTTFGGTTRHTATPSPTACGARSDHEVIWTIKPL